SHDQAAAPSDSRSHGSSLNSVRHVRPPEPRPALLPSHRDLPPNASAAPPLQFAPRRQGPAPLPSSRYRRMPPSPKQKQRFRAKEFADLDARSRHASPSAWDPAIRRQRSPPRLALHP